VCSSGNFHWFWERIVCNPRFVTQKFAIANAFVRVMFVARTCAKPFLLQEPAFDAGRELVRIGGKPGGVGQGSGKAPVNLTVGALGGLFSGGMVQSVKLRAVEETEVLAAPVAGNAHIGYSRHAVEERDNKNGKSHGGVWKMAGIVNS
jgi:hypothetical protein